MAETKRFYWLKLQENFFEDDTIRFIEEQENGIKYSNFYLKLCLKSLRTEGKLIRVVGEMLIPYDVKSLSSLTGVDVDTVRCAMALLEKIGCVKVLDSGELFISQLAELVGSETDKARLMRMSRAKSQGEVTMLPECYPEKEKEIEIEKDKELKKEKKRKRFTPPSLDEVKAYCQERNNAVNPEAFVDFYESKGWKVGREPMKDWKAAVRTWERRDKKEKDNSYPDYSYKGDSVVC